MGPTKSMIIVHHAGYGGENSTFQSIKTSHERRFKKRKKIGYHKVIEKSGRVETGLSDHESGAHTLGKDQFGRQYNDISLGVCLCGNFDKQVEPTDPQWASLVEVVADWCMKHGIAPTALTIRGHRDLQPFKNATKDVPKRGLKKGDEFPNTCPGKFLHPKLQKLRHEVELRIAWSDRANSNKGYRIA